MDSFWTPYIFLVGLAAGSFLNVCVWRLPRNRSVVSPESACPACKHAIRWRDNIPVLSWVFLRGKCRDCGARISIRYPAVELLTGLLFLFLWSRFPHDWTIVFPLYYGAALLAITLTDYDLQIIPDALSLPGIPLGLLWRGWIGGDWPDALIGMAVGGGSLWLIAELYFRIRKREGMGGGDVKLAAMMGAYLGWQPVLGVLFLSSLAGGLFGTGLILFRGGKGSAPIPFGVFLAPIGFLALLYGEAWVARYLAFATG
ncbi:MAG: A24 family peptidase [Candidatus Eisenbacteria bacterium]